MNHTPGPWNLGNSDLPVSMVSIHGGKRKHSTIARVVKPDFVGMSMDECLDNAKLIALAPEMLAALREIANIERQSPYEMSNGAECANIANEVLNKLKTA